MASLTMQSTSWYECDSLAPGVVLDFNALVTSNIIQSLPCGQEQLKERSGLEP
jgi:hypothetical protein